MVVQLDKGDRLILSAPIPGAAALAINILEVISTIEDSSGVASAIAELVKRDNQVVPERPRVLITFAPRDIPISPSG